MEELEVENGLKDTTIIKCPHCKYEYTLADIFMPDDLTGRPKQIIRDGMSHIIYVDYKEDYAPALRQAYLCDHCDRPFIVTAKISVEVEEQEEELDFSETSVSLLD